MQGKLLCLERSAERKIEEALARGEFDQASLSAWGGSLLAQASYFQKLAERLGRQAKKDPPEGGSKASSAGKEV